MKPTLSVIIPCYNHGQYLPEALESVDRSKFREQIEIIIINDGSTDPHTNKVISELDQKKYIIIQQQNQGLARSRNNGIKAALSDYVLMLDADNCIEQLFISEFFKILDSEEEFDALYGNAQRFGLDNHMMIPGEIDLFKLLQRNYIDACAIFKKEVVVKIGLYDENMPYMGLEDWDLWIRLAFENYRIKYSNKTFFQYRVLSDSMIRSQSNFRKSAIDEYVRNKYPIKITYVNRLVEDYINNHLSFKTLCILVLKKFKLFKGYCFKIKN